MKTKLLLSSLLIAASAGAQWIQQSTTIPGSVNLASIHCADANNCMVAGTTTSVRKTTDGTTWNQVGSTGIANKLFIKMKTVDTVMLGQDNCTFRKSVNNGATWTADLFGGNTNFDLFDIAFISSNNFTAVGGSPTNHTTGGHITTSSTDKGLTWPNFVNVSGQPTFFGIHALTTTTFVACGGAASVYKTTDAGANWTAKLSGTPTTTTLYDINFPTADGDTGYAVGGHSSTPTTGGIVYKTVNFGETWLPTASVGLAANALFGVHFVSKDSGYVVGDGGKIQVTTDGGLSWTAQISPVTTTLNKIYFPTDKIGYICGASGVIIKTTSGGFIPPLVANAGSDQSICPGACVTLGSAATGGTPPYSYAWSTGATSISITGCPSATTSYTVTVTDANSITASDAVTVTVHVNPAVSFSGLDATYCNQVTADVLTGTPTGGTFAGPGVTAGIFNASAAGAGTHTVTYTYTTTPGCVVSSSQSTTVLPLPTAVQLCLVTVDSAISNTSNIVTWVKPAAANIDSFRVYRKNGPSMIKIASVAYSAQSKYVDNSAGADPNTVGHTYAITTIDTCGIESVRSDSNTTMWLAKPAFNNPAKFDLSWTDYDGFTFTNYEIWRTINGGASWQKLNTVAVAAANTYTDIGAPLNSRYRIRATSPNSCNTGTDIFKYSLSNATLDYNAVNELSLSSWLHVYPNPNHGTFSVQLSGTGYEVTGMKVYNMLGEVVYQSAGKNKTAEISIPGITPGVYQLQVITDSGTANKKITIE